MQNQLGAASKNFGELTPAVQTHLVRVYSALALCIAAASAGAAMGPYVGGGALLWGLVGFGCLMWLKSGGGGGNDNSRRLILALFGLCEGLSLGDLMIVFGMVHDGPRLLLTALMSSFAIFACFSGSALLARRRSFLYLGGFLSSALSVLLILSIFGGSGVMFDINLYGGLLVFCGFVIFDTQLIVEKAALGSRDFAMHAAELFMDLFSVFIRICIILLKKSQEEQRRHSGTSNRSGNKRHTNISYSSTSRR